MKLIVATRASYMNNTVFNAVAFIWTTPSSKLDQQTAFAEWTTGETLMSFQKIEA